MPLITSRLSPVHRVRFAQFGPVVAVCVCVCVCASYTYKALYCRGLYTRKIAGRQQFLIIPNFKAYASACQRGEVRPGLMFIFETGQLTYPHYIINFPTKRHWRAKSRIEDIEAGLGDLVREIRERNIQSIAIPPLGSGLGKLDWADVRTCIEGVLGQCPHLKVTVFEPNAEFE